MTVVFVFSNPNNRWSHMKIPWERYKISLPICYHLIFFVLYHQWMQTRTKIILSYVKKWLIYNFFLKNLRFLEKIELDHHIQDSLFFTLFFHFESGNKRNILWKYVGMILSIMIELKTFFLFNDSHKSWPPYFEISSAQHWS